MNATIINAAEIAAELAEMYPVNDPGLSTPDRIVASKLAALVEMLAGEIARFEEAFDAAMIARYDDMMDARYDAISANWGHD